MVSDKRLSELADEKMICKLSWEEEKSVAQELQKYRQMYRWIPVGERTPEDDTLCLGIDNDGIIWTMNFEDGVFVLTQDAARYILPTGCHYRSHPYDTRRIRHPHSLR